MPVQAQEGLENLISTVGTTIQDRAGRHWAYLFWQGSSPELVLGRTYAVYAKPGDPSSAAPYQRLSIVAQQTDPRNIEPLLRRAENLGEDPVKLEQDLQSVFEALMPAPTISRAEKVSAAIRGSLAREEFFQNLLLMARVHPGVALALGVAYADVLPGLTTFEVRLFDPATEKDQGVIGRVTLQPGAPLVLPAPGAPVEVPDPSAQGDINVKLRWAAPDPLRRVGLLQYGFNVWRVTKAYAEAASNRWDLTPPAPATLLARWLSAPAHVKRCNNLPILTDKDFGTNDVGNFSPPPAGDPQTYFYSDDDGRFRPGYVNLGFTNGARFYYFVTARDILGRDGFVSPGTLLTVCDRNPPLPPDKVQVVNDYSFIGGTPRQFLRVIWNQNTNTADPVTNYWVYRWTNLNEMHAKAGNPTNNRIGIVRHTNGLVTTSFLDSGAGAPSVATDLGRTYWYTVRAQDQGACGPNLSGNSAPAFGVLRDRVGPDAPTGEIWLHCLKPLARFVDIGDPIGEAAPGRIVLRFHGERKSPQIAQIGYGVTILNAQYQTVETFFTGWMSYSPGQNVHTYTLSSTNLRYGWFVLVQAAVMTHDGQFGVMPEPTPIYLWEEWINDIVPLYFEAGLLAQRTRPGGGCTRHDPITPEGFRTNIVVIGYPTPGSREWRLYRRVDDGPMTLLCHGAIGGAPSFECQDDGVPPNGATLCYYLQVLDEHGNPSPMVKLGCVRTAPHAPPPAPLLSPLVPTGVTNNPGMTITWFCPPPGLERFEVWIAAKPAGMVSSNLAPGFLTLRTPTVLQPNPMLQTLVLNGQTNTYEFYVFLSPRIGPGFGPGPQFAAPTSIELGQTYTVFVKAVGRDGSVSEPSNIEQFVWNPANTSFPLCTIPWPARGLPPLLSAAAYTNTTLPVGITAAYLEGGINANFTGAVVVVGGAVLGQGGAGVAERPQWLKGAVNPMDYLFTNTAGEKLFPLALYRYQTTNSRFPRVSGDIVQVSPLLENIAYQITNFCIVVGPGRICYTNSLLWDAYIVYDYFPLNDLVNWFFMYLHDTQPVISGARYRYLLVRFRKNGEIAEVIPTNTMEVP